MRGWIRHLHSRREALMIDVTQRANKSIVDVSHSYRKHYTIVGCSEGGGFGECLNQWVGTVCPWRLTLS